MPPRRTPTQRAALRSSLLEHAQRLIRRDGAEALTMRALAAEAGCAVGLPYTVFADRRALVTELVAAELAHIAAELEAWVAAAGTGSVGANLDAFASILLDADAPALRLAGALDDGALTSAVVDRAHATGLAHALQTSVEDYLAAEQRLGRVAAAVDVAAFAFLVTGAVHNLVEAGAAYPRPDRERLRHHLHAVADRLAP